MYLITQSTNIIESDTAFVKVKVIPSMLCVACWAYAKETTDNWQHIVAHSTFSAHLWHYIVWFNEL